MKKLFVYFLDFPLLLFSIICLLVFSREATANSLNPIIIGQDDALIEEFSEKKLTADYCQISDQSPESTSSKILLTSITVLGKNTLIELKQNTVFSKQEILNSPEVKQLFSSLDRENMSLEEFAIFYQALAEAITQIYLTNGYINSIATTSSVVDRETEIAQIVVSQGSLASIQVIESGGFQLAYLCDRINLGITYPFNIIPLEKQLRLLNRNPQIENVAANLRASGKPGLSILEVNVEAASTFEVTAGADNYSPATLGAARINLGITANNPSGWGDEISTTYYRSLTGGNNLLDFTYRIPLNPQEGTLQIRALPSWTKITQAPLDQLDIRGENQVYEISFRQLIIRDLDEELGISLGFRYTQGETLGLNQPLLGDNRSSVIQFSQDYLSRDLEGIWSIRSQFNLGTGLFDATENNNFLPDGFFFSWLGQIQRLQRINRDHLLVFQGEIQLSPDPLIPDYLFIIGGGQSLRGYRQNVRSGDNGFRLSIEDRITLARNDQGSPQWQIAPFMDLGQVWNSANNPIDLPSQTFLISAGIGLIWQPIDSLNLRLDYGYPLVNLEDRGNNLQDDGLYFQFGSSFSF